MTESPAQERRRFKRVECKGEYFWRTVVNAPVRVLDISEGGALLASSTAVPMGQEGRLRVRIGGMPFEAEVKLVRVLKAEPPVESMPYQVAAVFSSMDERSRGLMAQFLKNSGVRGGTAI